MKLSAVLLARVVFFVESADLNPYGQAYYPDIVAALVKRYGFLGYPQKLEDFDEQKGVTLSGGKFNDKTILKVVIYNWGLSLETNSSTKDAEALLLDALSWATANLRLNFAPEMVRRRAYISHLTFYSDAPLLSLNPVLEAVGEGISKEVLRNLKLDYRFQPRGVSLSIDPETQRIPVQQFTLERRDGAPYSEGKYFSAAPVQTDVHVSLLEEFERSARARRS